MYIVFVQPGYVPRITTRIGIALEIRHRKHIMGQLQQSLISKHLKLQG